MRKNSKVINYSIYKYTIEIIENVSIRYLVLKLLNYFLYFILIISKSILESSTEKILRAESNHLTVQIFDESFLKENKRTYKEKTLLLFFNARRALNSKFVLIQSIHTRLVQKENLVDSERYTRKWFAAGVLLHHRRKRRKRIAKRKIDEERWLDDCVVLFLVRKQYLTIPFGDLNSYNGRQEEKEGGKSGQNVLLDELTNPRLGWMLLNHIVHLRIFFHSPLWIFLQNILRGITYWLECVHISDQSIDLFIFGAEFLFNKFRRKIRSILCAKLNKNRGLFLFFSLYS